MNIEEAKKYIGDNVDLFIDRLAGLAFQETLASNLKELQVVRGGVFLRDLGTRNTTREIDEITEKLRKKAMGDLLMYDAITTLKNNNALDDYTRTLASLFFKWSDVEWCDISYELINVTKPKKGLFAFLLSSQESSVTVKILKLPQVIIQFLAAFERFAQSENLGVEYLQMTPKTSAGGYGSIPMEEANLYEPFTFVAWNVSQNEIDNQVDRFIKNMPSGLSEVTKNIVITAKLKR